MYTTKIPYIHLNQKTIELQTDSIMSDLFDSR